jgi:tetratricopeptide (TPR) repeat protein
MFAGLLPAYTPDSFQIHCHLLRYGHMKQKVKAAGQNEYVDHASAACNNEKGLGRRELVMVSYHFFSYSSFDGWDIAVKLCDELEAGPPAITTWLDQREIRPGQDWDTQVVEALRTCKSLVFIMTLDSVEDESECKNEWTRALKYKKPIIPLRFHRDVEMPFRLGSRNYIDFAGNFNSALARLRKHLQWLSSQEGELQTLKYRLQDALRDLRRAIPEERTRIQDEIEALRQQIVDEEDALQNPQEAKARVEESIQSGIQRERQPEESVTGTTRTKFINPPPIIAPSYFQDRHVETKLIGDFLKDDALRLMTVVGRAGIGKSAMVCRLLKSLEGGRLPDDGGELSVDGIVYLSERGSRGVSVPLVYADLCRLLPDDVAEQLDRIYKDPRESIEAKMHALLDAFPEGRYVLLLDNFEDKIDPETRKIEDTELKGALHALLEHPHHAIKVIVTTRFAPEPRELAVVRPERQKPLNMDEGLPSKDAKNMLREMDADGTVGLKTAPEELLEESRERTRGFPRALEALYAILAADRDTTLRELLDDTKDLLPENVVEELVGEAFSSLDQVAQIVMQALAIYGFPVTPAAVNYLLLPYRIGGVDSAPVLGRLVNMQFVRREAGQRYYLHPVDRAYALSRVPEDEESDRYGMEAPPFTQIALLRRAANYLAQTRTPRESWKTIEDLAPQLQEFELRYAGEDYDTAANVLLEIGPDYLLLWGHYRLMTDMQERLLDKLSDPYLQLDSLNSLSSAYTSMGRYQKTIASAEQALAIAREVEDRTRESQALSNLGDAYNNLGRYQEAIAHFEQALDIDREIDNQTYVGIDFGSLGNSYSSLGRYQEAIAYTEQALEIAREIGDMASEGSWLGNLGNSYNSLGRDREALEYTEQALEIARETGNRSSETWLLYNIGAIHLDRGQLARAKEPLEHSLDIAREIVDRRMEAHSLNTLGNLFEKQAEWNEAQQHLKQAIQIADEIEEQQAQRRARMSLAHGYLYAGDLRSARTAIDEARRYESQGYNYNLLALAGVIALRTGDSAAAQAAFQEAVAQAEAQLSYSEQVYGALDSKGLALCGLALATEDKGFIPPALDAYRKAREITTDAGIVADVLRLFDALQEADAAGVLTEVREVAAGTEVNSI